MVTLIGNSSRKLHSRRAFLRTAPLTAAAALALTDKAFFGLAPGAGLGAGTAAPGTFQLFTAKAIQDDVAALQAKPGNNSLIDSKALPFTVVMTTEVGKSAKEFEWHENRDHILQILDGTTRYEVGGTPQNGRNTKPGEWLAPVSEGATTITLTKGDMLVIPRGTPHKRSTEGSVTFFLISPMGPVKS